MTSRHVEEQSLSAAAGRHADELVQPDAGPRAHRFGDPSRDRRNTEREVVRFVAEWIRRELGVEPLVEEVGPGRENIIATLDSGTPGPCLMLEGHTDVVSEGDRERWTRDPFGGEIVDGRIYGRGSCDMKAGVAVALLTAEGVQAKSGVPWKGKIRLGLVCDEEGMMLGIKHFIRGGHADDVDACLVPEPEENQLCLSMKGAIRADRARDGEAWPTAPCPSPASIPTRASRGSSSPSRLRGDGEAAAAAPTSSSACPRSPSRSSRAPPPGSPAQLNVMPGEAVGYVDIRTVPKQDHDTVRGALRRPSSTALAPAIPTSRPTIEFIEDRPVVAIGKDEPIVRGGRIGLPGRDRAASPGTTGCRAPPTARS